jgi:hypothetical protein
MEIASKSGFNDAPHFRLVPNPMLIAVISWPSPVGDGSTDISIEYEVDSGLGELQDVTITIPLPM